MLDIFNDNSYMGITSYPEEFWYNQVNTWSLKTEQAWFVRNMKDWENAIQTS